MKYETARETALAVVTAVRARDAYAHEVLAATLERATLAPRDRAFATRLAYGTIACRGTLDEAVARHVARPNDLEPEVADALAITAYELLFLKSPAHAAVSEGVNLVKAHRERAAGLANAVLRKVAASASDFPWGDTETDDEALARLHGHPLWLAQMWIEQLGRERATAVMAADNEPAPLYFAHLPFERSFDEVLDALSRDGVEPVAGDVAGSIEAGSPSAAVGARALARRDVVVCDAAAQLAAACVRPATGASIVDIGAGRGTKTLILAGLARLNGGKARVQAIDSHGFKLDELKRLTESLGLSEVHTCCTDAVTLDAKCAPTADSADAVLVDAPCSGLGTLRRHPDRRWRAKPDECETLAVLGGSLLRSAARLVKPGGFVVYSTCTVSRVENVDVVDAFLGSEAGEGFVLDSVRDDTPAAWTHWVDEAGRFQSLPEVGGPDGHFIARLKRA